MNYHAPTNQFTVSAHDLKLASRSLKCAINHIRIGHGLDPKGYVRSGPMDHPEFAEQCILDAAKDIGIDLGADWSGRLDVSNEG